MAGVPRGWRLLARILCHRSDRKFVLSDLEEEFLEISLGPGGVREARRWYAGQVLRSTLPFLAGRVHHVRNGLRRPDVPRSTGPRTPLGEVLMHGPLRNLRLALRTLMKSPLVVLVTITSLSLGIGASSSVFTIINAFLFQESQGLRDPEGLVAIYTSADHGGLYGESSFPDYLTLHEESETLEDLVAFRAGFLTFDPPTDAPEAPADRLIVEIVTGNYFDVMGIRLPLGRGFSPEETELGQAEDLIVLSHEAWMDRFGGDPGILGRALHLDNREFTVIGVGPPGLVSRLLRLKVSGWVPFGTPTGIWHATPEELASRRDHDCIIMARLKEGTPIDAVRSELGLIATRLTEEYPEAWTDNRGEPRAFTVVTERESRLPPDGRQALAGLGATLMGGAFLILLIACSNVAGLFLARAEKRRREMAIRLSMGASRRRLAGMLLTESLLLGLLGGAGGLAIAWWFAEFMAAIPLPLDVPLAFDVGLDGRVVGFTALVAVGAAVLFGILPAVRGSRPDLVPALKSDQAVAGKRPGRFGLRNLLVLGQVTASLVLLVGAGLFLRTLQSSASLDVGFNPDRVAILWKELEPEHRTPEGAAQYVQEIEARLEAFPEVEDAEVARRADASVLDLADRAILEIAGYQSADGRPIVQSYTSVSPGFAEMMELPVLRGRTFTEGDGPGAPGVAMVNEAFVRRYWPDSDGLGERFTMLERREVDTPTAAPPTAFEVVGIVRDQPPAFPGARTGPFVWIPYLQDYSSRAIIHLKGRTSAAEMVPILRKEVPLRLGEVPLIPAQTYREALRGRFLGQEIAAKLLAWAGLFALGLAVIGIFGIVSFAVGRRVREMAIRQAVGADRGQILGSLVWEGMFLTVVGLVLGLALAVPLAMTLRGLLFGIRPLDPLAVGAGAGLLLAAAFVACLIPAMRVMGIDPMEVLREE